MEITDLNLINKGGIYIITGIYKITNLSNNRIYIGESFDIERRWEQHKKDLVYGKHINKALQKDFNIYGRKYFKFEVLQEHKSNNSLLTQAHLIMLEDSWIKLYKDRGYEMYNIEESLKEILSGNKSLQIAPAKATHVLISQLRKYNLVFDSVLHTFSFEEKYNNVKCFLKSLYCVEGKNLSGSKSRSLSAEIEEYIKKNKLEKSFYKTTTYPYHSESTISITEITEECKKYIVDNYYEIVNTRRMPQKAS